jgi:predicted glycoside hydrolase/deacetylase ChbG (UPF0249 family)
VTSLCVTADDFGLRAENDDVILGLQDHLDAVSIAVHADATLERVRELRVATGLHLVLVGERPLVPRALEPILDGEGRLPVSWPWLFAALARRPSLAAALRSEIAAQLDRFLALGLSLDFVNSHQHTHLFPLVWRELRRELTARKLAPPIRVTAGANAKELALVAAQRAAFALYGAPPGRRTIAHGLAWSGHADDHHVAATIATIARSPDAGLAELIFHPGGNGAAAPRHARWRYHWREEAALLAAGVVDRCAERWSLARARPDHTARSSPVPYSSA